MKLYCKSCGEELKYGTKECPYCGQQLVKTKTARPTYDKRTVAEIDFDSLAKEISKK